MKKLFAVMAIFALVLAGCGDSSNNYGEIGKTGQGGGIIFFAEGGQYKECSGELGDATWDAAVAAANNYKGGGFTDWHLPDSMELDLVYKNLKKNGLAGLSNGWYWTSVVSSTGNAYCQDFYDGKQAEFFKSRSFSVRAVRSYSTNIVTPTVNTTLKIKNESSTDITDVIWQGVSFAASATDNSIKKGVTVPKTVQPGSGYIYFKRSANPITARTREVVVIAEKEQKEFIFIDATLIVDVDNQDNTGTLGSLQPIITSLKIQNESYSEITEVKWSNIPFTEGAASINTGSFVTKNVQEGSGYIYFKRKTDSLSARTSEPVAVGRNEQKAFIINDDTVIVDVDNSANTGAFGVLGVKREPQITVQAGSAAVAQFGDYDFGSVLLNTDKDVTFTIGNSGRADLRFNVVEGNVINLSNNASGYFSVIQQPFATMTIAPGSATTFIIRFGPMTIANNFNAEVKVATNSEQYAEFTFRVKGNGRNYIIGDTGPGGGKIFFAQGGQYKECSGELGAYNWTDAVNAAQNHRGGGFTDWRLPDIGELDLMYQNRTIIGGFSLSLYWSSTLGSGSSNHIYMDFSTGGGSSYYSGSSIYRVRAVRDFSL